MSLPTQGQTQWANAIPTLVAQEALPILKKIATFVRSVYSNGDIASFGKPFTVGNTINIRLPNAYTGRTKSEDTAIVFDSPTADKVAVVLNKYDYVAIGVEDLADMTADTGNMRLVRQEAEPIAYGLVQVIESRIAHEYSNFAQIGTPGALITPDLVRQAAQTLDDNYVLPNDRYMKLRPKDIYALLGHPDFIPYFSATQIEAIRNGIVGNLYGFEIDKSQYVYSAAGVTYGMAYHRSAIALVQRPFQQPLSQGVTQAVVSDPETGLALTSVLSWDQSYQADTLVMKIVSGVKTLRASCGVCILT